MEKIEKKIKTAMLALVWLCLGLYQSISGPTLIDLTIRFQSNYDEIGRAMSSIGVGIFLGAIIGGVLVDVKTSCQDALIVVPQLFAIAALLLVPYMGDVTALWFMFLVLGSTVGMVNIGSQRMLVKMWTTDVAVPFHLVHLALGIGSVLAPVMADSFLAELVFNESNTTASLASSVNQTTPAYTVAVTSRVDLAYVTTGAVTACLSLPFFIYSVYKWCNRLRNIAYEVSSEKGEVHSNRTKTVCQIVRRKLDPGSVTNGYRGFGIFAIVCLALHFVNSAGGQQAFANFIRTFSVDELKFAKDGATYLNTAFWISFTVGRLVSTLLAYFLSTQNMLLICTIWHATAAICLLTIVGTNHILLWLFTAFVGSAIGPTNPAFMSHANTKIKINGIVLTFIACAQGSGNLLYLWVTGVLYNAHGPRVVLYVEVFYAIAIVLITITFVAVARRRGNVYKQDEPTNVNVASAEGIETI